MRAPGEVMAENIPPPALPSRSSPMLEGRSSPLRTSSPVPGKKGINRAQLTLQELQDLAERQRKQILYNSKELMEKQQQLMKMHQDFRTRLKKPDSPRIHAVSPRSPVEPAPSPRGTKLSPKSPVGKREQDQYAKMLRETYSSVSRMQGRNSLQKEVDVRKFSNVELAHELEKVRAIFSSKQNELADAVKKVDVLTHGLEQRKNGDSSWGSVPTPERINRRKKIQAAKDEMDRLRNELIVRNEMNSQQSHQLQLQRDIIHEKKQELRDLNSRMNELNIALKKKGGKLDPNRKIPNHLVNGGQQVLFNQNYLQDTLSRKKKHVIQDINANHVTVPPPMSNGIVNGEKEDLPSVFQETPISGNQIWRNNHSLNIQTDGLNNKPSPLHSPSSSISSLSSLSSTSVTTPDDLSKPFPFSRDLAPPPPPRTTPTGVLTNRNEPEVKAPNEEFLAHLRAQKQKISKLQGELETVNKTLTPYTDSQLSMDSDKLGKYEQYGDATSSCIIDTLSNTKPPVKPKPAIAKKPVTTAEEGFDSVDRAAPSRKLSLLDDDVSDITPVEEHSSLLHKLTHEVLPKDANDQDGDEMSWPSPPTAENVPDEPDDFELSFADIDEINEIQTDLWSNSEESSVNSQNSYDSDFDDIEKAVVPVVISVSPDKMPPPILMKPDKPRKQKRRVVLEPFALLLDSALEGELDEVKEILKQVPDPSKPNPEGITALHNAVCGNHKDVVKYLVEVACDINLPDKNGWTPLHCAAFYNDTELCSYLVEHGASVFATTYADYQTPAHKCSRLDDNYDECFGYLHECKENVGRINGGLVHALYDYTSENDDELSFYCGDELTVLRRGDTVEKEWWWGRDRKGNTGYIPCNLVGNYPRIAAVV